MSQWWLDTDDKGLRTWHRVASGAHLSQAVIVAALVGSQEVPRSVRWPVTRLGWRGTVYASTDYPLGALLPIFPALSSAHHSYLGWGDESRLKDVLDTRVNASRWLEYSVSASVLTWVIAQLAGITEVELLTNLVLANVALQTTGYLVEQAVARKDFESAYTVTYAGWAVFLAQWFPILLRFFTVLEDRAVPDSVYSIIFVLLFFYACFGIAQLAYVRACHRVDKDNKGDDEATLRRYFIRYEQTMLALSLSSKSFLTWMCYGGVLNANLDTA